MGYYDKNTDYSELIAQETNEEKRQQLLAERQNKIDAEGLAGKVAGNEAVSTWTNGYRPYSVSSTTAGALQVSGLYDAAEQSRFQRFEAERRRIAKRLRSNLSAIDSDYRAGMRQTEINAKQSALLSEEALAALGLNMGAKIEGATSGAAETSRVSMDNQYRGDLNALGTARLDARAAAEQQAADREAALESGYYATEADAALAQAQSALAQYNADRQYGLSAAGLSGFLNGTPTLAHRESSANTESARQSAAYERAFERWKAYGYVLQNDAATLGVAAGTPTADKSYKDASLALQRWKSGYYY